MPQDRNFSKYCRNCFYPLDQLGHHECPECGTLFDLDNWRTWCDRPPVSPWHELLMPLGRYVLTFFVCFTLTVGVLFLLCVAVKRFFDLESDTFNGLVFFVCFICGSILASAINAALSRA
ncbi:hypothetical protein [Poriferisphaera sp. WC338]|uniref:hypothetical protein n=1 Tax=Poriferisphaera sp. WC338 TaxID=3425129 RepID=UPI003D817747